MALRFVGLSQRGVTEDDQLVLALAGCGELL